MLKFKFDTFYLKLFAIVLMLIDHVAYIFIPITTSAYWLLRMIGRLSAPIFMYCFAVGYKKTSNRSRYITRLAISAMVMSTMNILLPFTLNVSLFAIDFWVPNMFLTFFLMAIVIGCVEQLHKSKNILYLPFAIIPLLVVGLKAEYGWYAVCTILPFYFIKNKNLSLITFVVLNTVLCLLMKNFIQFFMVLAALPIAWSVQDKPRKQIKWFFYVFYPLHFIILIIIKHCL